MSNLLLTEEEQMLQKTVRDFAERELAPRASQIDEQEEFPWENIRGLASLGLFGLGVDPDYGGSGGTTRQVVIAIEEIARCCAATSTIYEAHLSLAIQTIYTFGTEGQKRRFVPPMVRGEKIGAFGLSEPGCGTDAAALQTTATKKNGRYLLNGAKLFITNGDVAEVFVVFATHDRSLRSKGISAFVVEKGTRGLTANRQHGKMGMRASSTAELVFQDCPVPEENRLGDEGTGFKAAMQILDPGRIYIAAQCVGMAQAALESSVRYAQQRQAFGQPLASFQAIQWMIADMATEVEAARLLTYHAASLRDGGQPFATEASMAKLFASQAAVRAADRAVQVHGGYGYFRPSTVERLYRDARVTQIYEGTSEVQRMVIARSILQAMGL